MTPGKLLVEFTEPGCLDYIIEASNSNEKEKDYRISGIFMEAENVNKNGRIYPKSILEREVKRYTNEEIASKRSIGSLDHPPQSTVLLENACHIVESLYMEGNLVKGVARILDTPKGKIAKVLMKEGITLCVSSRSVGSLDQQNRVGDNLRVLALDIVQNPSVAKAVVESIIENKDYIVDGNNLVEVNVKEFMKDLSKNGSKNLYENLDKFIKSLSRKL